MALPAPQPAEGRAMALPRLKPSCLDAAAPPRLVPLFAPLDRLLAGGGDTRLAGAALFENG